MHRAIWAIVLAIITCATSANAEIVQWVNASRISFGDAVPDANGPLASLDLGAAPPPGGSRLFSRDELKTYASQAHEETNGLAIPQTVRVKRTSQRFTARELESLVRPSLAARLPEGVELRAVVLPNSYLSVPHLQVGQIQMPKLPKRVGVSRMTAVVELLASGTLVGRLPVACEIQTDERATRFALARGAQLSLVIESGAARVSATATLMNPADIGDVVACQVIKTRKVLLARVVTAREATVVQQ